MHDRHNQLLEQCLELGLPASREDDIETLEGYLKVAADDEDYFDSELTDDLLPPARVKKRGILKKLNKVALFFSKG